MKTPRLLPVVIAASMALLLFKGIGLLTSGGYVLLGTGTAQAEDAAAPSGAAAAGADATMALPQEASMTDSSPTLTDNAVTLPVAAEAAPAADGTAAPDASADHAAAADPAAAADAAVAAMTACPPAGAGAPPAAPADPAAPAATGDNLQGFDFSTAPPDCTPDPGVNAAGDALPLTKDGSGNIVPLKDVSGDGDSTDAVLARLTERRDALDAREKELDMRSALVEAAEKQMQERTDALQALEAKINSLVAEKKTAEQQQFVGLVAMYETMKPKDAATIFDKLDLPVLLRVAQAMNPRKMGPILARMDPAKAKDLTSGLAADQAEPAVDVAGQDLTNLPQIVGQ